MNSGAIMARSAAECVWKRAARSRDSSLPRTICVALVLLTAVSVGGRATADDLFVRPRQVALPASADAIHVADLNEDGLPDLVVAHSAAARVSVLLGRSPGSFGRAESFDVGLSPIAIRTGDVDDDGDDDIVVLNMGASSISTVLNRGGGRFERGPESGVAGRSPRVFNLGRLGNGVNVDAVVCNFETNDVEVLEGDGKGGFASKQRLDAGNNPHALELGNFDGDSLLDLAAPVYEEATELGKVYWFKGKPDGSFEKVGETAVTSIWMRFAVSGDLDQDGLPDVAAIDANGNLHVLRNRGGWTFDVASWPPSTSTEGVEVTWAPPFGFLSALDLDGDGDLDVALRAERGIDIGFRVYWNEPQLAFSTSTDFIAGPGARSFSFADLNLDGLPEAIASAVDDTLRVYYAAGRGAFSMRASIGIVQTPRSLSLMRRTNDSGRKLAAVGSSVVYWLGWGPADTPLLEDAAEFPGFSFTSAVSGDFDGELGDELALAEIVDEEVLVLSANDPADIVATHSAGGIPAQLVAGDIDRDGKSDLLLTRRNGEMATVILSPASDGVRFDVPLGAVPGPVCLGDVDNDGMLDLVAEVDGGIDVLCGNGTGFNRVATVYRTDEDVTTIFTADPNGDARADAVLVSRLGWTIVYSIAMPPDVEAEHMELAFPVRSAVLHDVDSDGHEDLVLGLEGQDRVAILLCDGHGFGAPEFYETGGDPRHIVVADLNGDGRADVSTADFLSRSVSVLKGLPVLATAFLRGDASGDGSTNVTDAVVLLEHLFRGGNSPGCRDAADMDDDGRLAITDAIFLLQHLFLGGAPPPEPYPECGLDATNDVLDCAEPPCT